MWRWLLASLVVVGAAPVDAARQRGGEELVQVITPTSRAVADAHPHVNVVIAFGTAKDGTPADPATFRAKLNGRDVTDEFRAVVTNGVETGRRATLPQPRLRLATAPRNRLRLSVQGVKAGGAKRARDVDRLRFGAADVPNRPPVVMLAAGSDVTAVGAPVTFDASGSHDPDLDELSFDWSFSDAGTASGPTVTHAFGAADSGMASATVVVSDGVDSVPQTLAIPLALTPDPGRTPGTLRIEAAGPLELAAVAIGATATRSLTVRNVDTTPTSQVKIRALVLGSTQFAVAPATLDLGPDGSATVDVTFVPSAAGHAGAQLLVVTSAANRAAVSFIAHGHGGGAPGDGPTLVDVPLFASFGGDVARLAPDGTRTPIDAGIGLCAPPGVSSGGDVCAANGDCASGEVCGAGPFPIDVAELCGDGQALYVLSEESYQDQREEPDTELSGTLVRFDLDAEGSVVGRKVLTRTTDETSQLACDGAAAGAGGFAYLAEFRTVPETDTCARDERDALVAVNKNTGGARAVSGLARMDGAADVGECDFRDGVSDLVVTPDGVRKYAGFDSRGLWRLTPAPLWFTPDVRELFDADGDGSVVFAVGRDRGAVGAIELYRVAESQVEHGALPLTALTPCATFTVPNNGIGAAARTLPTSIALGPSSAGATALVTFHAGPSSLAFDVLPPFGDLRGTVAFSIPAGSTACSVVGLVSLQAFELSR